MKMFISDFSIKSEHDLEEAVESIAEHIERDIESCPYFRRAKKATERMIRFLMKHLKVTDLPTGKRAQWVNKLAKELYDIMKSETSIEDLEDFVEDTIEDFAREVEHYFEEINRIEQTYNKNGGI